MWLRNASMTTPEATFNAAHAGHHDLGGTRRHLLHIIVYALHKADARVVSLAQHPGILPWALQTFISNLAPGLIIPV
jgi:hypothetical protein